MLINASKNKRGDTIVEVLIAMVVIAFALTTAYSLSIRAYNIGQTSQERLQALRYVEQQIELVKYGVENGRLDVDSLHTPPPFNPVGKCMSEDGTLQTNCKWTIDSKNDSAGLFTVNIDSFDKDTHTFTFKATWFAMGTGNVQNVTISYRVHPL